jgi:lysophospholipase
MLQVLPPQPTSGLVSVPGNPVPPGAVVHSVVTSDGTKLRAASWPDEAPRGTVVIMHGRGDFIERYFETIAELRMRGFAATCFDFRGQGGSQRLWRNSYRSSVRRFSNYEDDLAAVMNTVVMPDCPPPYYLLGHSTGGLAGLLALRHRDWFERAVLTSPLLGVHPGGWPLPVARALAKTVPLIGGSSWFLPGYAKQPLVLAGFDGNPLTLDRRRFQRDVEVLKAEPSLGIGGPTFGWLRAAFAAMDEAHSRSGMKKSKTPVLIVAAGRDRVVNTESTRRFAAEAAGVSLVVIADAMHEILMERDVIRKQFFAAFDSFIGAD